MNLEKLKYQIRAIEREAVNGNAEAIKSYIDLKELKDEIEESMELIKDSAIYDFQKQGVKTYLFRGWEISETAGGRYDYKDIPQWNEAKVNISAIEKKAQFAAKAGCVVDGIIPAIYSFNRPGLAFKKSKN